MAGVHAGLLVVVLGGLAVAEETNPFVPEFAPDEPVVLGPVASDVTDAGPSTRAALAALSVIDAWPAAPRPVAADDLLPERALAGEDHARTYLVSQIYRPLAAADPAILDTVDRFFDSGGSVEGTARALFVHPNTVRYRIRRVTALCGMSLSEPREAFTIRVAIALGRLPALARR
jgi:DNA-binding PucR family transcriptional regulator